MLQERGGGQAHPPLPHPRPATAQRMGLPRVRAGVAGGAGGGGAGGPKAAGGADTDTWEACCRPGGALLMAAAQVLLTVARSGSLHSPGLRLRLSSRASRMPNS